jgi:hypothetical protein
MQEKAAHTLIIGASISVWLLQPVCTEKIARDIATKEASH